MTLDSIRADLGITRENEDTVDRLIRAAHIVMRSAAALEREPGNTFPLTARAMVETLAEALAPFGLDSE